MRTKTRVSVFNSLVYLFLMMVAITAICILWAMYYDLPNLYHPAQTAMSCEAPPAPCCAHAHNKEK